jgi:hypothetical protein
VRAGDVWRYFCASNAPSSPATAWREVTFDDSLWLQGPSGFSTANVYPDYQATTWPSPPANYGSIFFRRTFNLADAASVKWLVLRLAYQDGFVAYLNGQEIARRGLTNTPPAFNDYAAYYSSGRVGLAEDFDVTAAAGLLRTGTNVLAIELHTAVTNEPSLVFTNHMVLVPELLANFQRGPFLQNATTNSIQVIWRTPVPADTVVEYGTNETFGAEFSEATLTTNHVATLTDLLPGTRYFYQVRSTATTTAASPTNSFRTLRPSGDVCFLEIGDSGDGSVAQYSLVGAMTQAGADLVVHVGDILYPDFLDGLVDLRCLSVYGPMMRSVPFFCVMGNHDVDIEEDGVTLGDGGTGEEDISTFYMPTNPVTGTEHFYSFDHGDVHFVVLFLPELAPSTSVLTNYELYEGSAQYGWLTNDLAASSKPWKFIFMHFPLATSAFPHRFDTDNQNNPHFDTIYTNLYDWQVAQDLLLPVAQRYGVQMFFSGHSHIYERFMPINGVHISVDGCGGFDNMVMAERDVHSSQFYSAQNVASFTKVTVHGDSLLLQGIRADGSVFDYMTLQRALPPAQVYDATWNTPLVEITDTNSPTYDGHGNITGQTFNLVGTPIPALAGFSANLGCVYVNNDATNLFLGFAQSMFPSNSTVFLFIESPRQGGVTNLFGLGDGIAGSGEGVDGLDFIENLSFTNFAPSIACLLGDEYADGQDRSFMRPGQAFPFGQGVFRLDPGFTDVAGVRLQQFNGSPQQANLFGYSTNFNTNPFRERNADFMEVAIPLAQLGGLQPGDTIRIAAVVGLVGCDTNAQTRELDTGFLGSSMGGSGQSNVVLGAISVRLAPKLLLVRADDLIRAYGATNPPLTITCTGFINGDDASALSGSPGLSTPANTNSPVGVYPINLIAGTLSNASYSFSCTNGTLTITPALLTMTADNQARYYGATNPPLTVAYNGFVNGQDTNILSGAPLLFTTAGTNGPVGTYPVVPSSGTLSLADTNYSLAFSNGTLTVMPALLTMTADLATRSYGATNPILTFTYNGFVNGEDSSVLSGSPVISTPAETSSPVGVYPIELGMGTLSNANYQISCTNRTLTITQAMLLVKPADLVRGYGGTNPPLSANYNGFVNGADTNLLSGAPQLLTTAGTNSPVGAYGITPVRGTLVVADTNYGFTFSDGTLTITSAVLTVRAGDQARIYGATNPLLTVTYSGFVNGQDTNILSGAPLLLTTAGTNSPVGAYWITPDSGTLVAADTNYCLGFSNGILTILPASSTNALLSSQNPSTNGVAVTFTASVSPIPPATTIPTGGVGFLTNGVLLVTAGLSNGLAQASLGNLLAGTNEVAAAYFGDNNYLGCTNRLQQVVLPVPFPCAGGSFTLNIVESGANTFALTLMGTTNAQYCLLETTNVSALMTNWNVLLDSTNAATNGLWYYTITNTGAPGDASNIPANRFFRARAVNPCP